MNRLKVLGDRIIQLVKVMVFILTSALVSMVFLQVVLRYVFHSSIIWIEELERYIFIWLMFLGIILGVHGEKHIAITTVIDKFSQYIKSLRYIRYVFSGLFFIFFTWAGIQFAITGFSGFASVLPVRLGYVYMIMPIASVFAVIFILIKIIHDKEAS